MAVVWHILNKQKCYSRNSSMFPCIFLHLFFSRRITRRGPRTPSSPRRPRWWPCLAAAAAAARLPSRAGSLPSCHRHCHHPGRGLPHHLPVQDPQGPMGSSKKTSKKGKDKEVTTPLKPQIFQNLDSCNH